MIKSLLVIFTMGFGSGTGAGVATVPYNTEAGCQAAAETVNKHKTRYVYAEAVCIEGEPKND